MSAGRPGGRTSRERIQRDVARLRTQTAPNATRPVDPPSTAQPRTAGQTGGRPGRRTEGASRPQNPRAVRRCRSSGPDRSRPARSGGRGRPAQEQGGGALRAECGGGSRPRGASAPRTDCPGVADGARRPATSAVRPAHAPTPSVWARLLDPLGRPWTRGVRPCSSRPAPPGTEEGHLRRTGPTGNPDGHPQQNGQNGRAGVRPVALHEQRRSLRRVSPRRAVGAGAPTGGHATSIQGRGRTPRAPSCAPASSGSSTRGPTAPPAR